ncbi:MAG: hypothetical protein RLZZ591_441 [Pseudomonadota bacterium]|jgi:ABC-2 type transport system ATP-binding protein
MPELLLNAQGLHKSYGGKPALSGVDLRVFAGEMVVLLGPNGAGKSTLLQVLTGLFSPDQGQVQVAGFNMQSHASRALSKLGVVFQQSALDLDLSVQANLLFHTDLHGIARADALQRIAEGLGNMGLSDQAAARVRTLSGGTRRKVELIRALLHRPRVLLMDEATVGLDPGSRQQLLQTVRALTHAQQVSVLWTTHLVEEIREADRLVLLQRGKVQFNGTLHELMAVAPGQDLEQEVLRLLAGVP